MERITPVFRILLNAAYLAQAQLGDLVREDRATEDDKEAYRQLKSAIKRADLLKAGVR